MHSDWFNRLEILQGRWQHGEKVGYCYPSGHKKTLSKWDMYVPLVTKWLMLLYLQCMVKDKPFLVIFLLVLVVLSYNSVLSVALLGEPYRFPILQGLVSNKDHIRNIRPYCTHIPGYVSPVCC
jgi:hypothetical protein